MAMEAETLRRVKSDVRSVLLSAPRGVLKRNFRREYISLVGQDIPLGRLGIRSMDEFVSAFPDVIRESTCPSTGEPTYFVVANAQTQHVASLVARQKKPSLKALRKAAPIQRPSMPKKRSWNKPTSRPAPSRGRRWTGQPFRTSTSSHANRFIGQPLLRGSITAIQNQGPPPAPGQSRGQATSFVPAGAEPYHLSNQNLTNPSLLPTPNGERPSNSGIPPWKEEYNNAFELKTVEDVINSKGQYKDRLICVTGYPANHDTIKQYDGEFRVLLFNNYISSRPKAPVLNTFFGNSWWNIKQYRGPYSFPPRGGCKIKVWGTLQYRFWQVRGVFRHSLKAVYYELICKGSTSRSFSSGQQNQLKITIPGSSSTSPRGNGHSPSMTRLSSSSSIDSNSDYSSTSGRSSPVTSSLQEWLKDQLKDKHTGLWGRVLVSQYKRDFRTEPPQNLLKEICSQPFIKFDEASEGNPIVYLSIEKKDPPIPDTAELTISDKDWINVLVVSVIDPCDFHVQCLSNDCSKALEKLTEDMSHHFSTSSSSNDGVVTVCKDVLYGVCWTESSEWCRALVLNDPDSQHMVHVKYPDYGNEDKIPVSSLRKLPHKFYSLPLQAIHCSLIDFTDISDKAIELFNKMTFEKCCQVMVVERSCGQYIVDLIPPDEDESIMDLIGQALNPVEGLLPCLPQVGDGRVSVKLVEVCQSDPTCIVVNIIGRGTEILNRVLNNMDEQYQAKSSHDQLSKHQLKEGMLCCAEFEGHWHRVRVKKILSPDNVLIQYIDYGTEEPHDPSCLMKPSTDHYMNTLPPQAVPCKLYGIEHGTKDVLEFNNSVLEFLLNYLEQELYLEMFSDTECVLYDQLNDRNINDLIKDIAINITSSPKSLPPDMPPLTSLTLTTPTSPVNNEVTFVKDSFANIQSLDRPAHDIFMVTVTHCVSPQEFTIQLCDNYEKLHQLHEDIQVYCNKGSPPKLAQYQEGFVGIGCYHGDNQWYRVLLTDTLRLSKRNGKIVKEIPVLFVDYGNDDFISEVFMITNNHLNQLPFQGIPAYLHIPGRARLRCSNEEFVQFVSDKQFYCHVKGFNHHTKRYSVSLMDIDTIELIRELL